MREHCVNAVRALYTLSGVKRPFFRLVLFHFSFWLPVIFLCGPGHIACFGGFLHSRAERESSTKASSYLSFPVLQASTAPCLQPPRKFHAKRGHLKPGWPHTFHTLENNRRPSQPDEHFFLRYSPINVIVLVLCNENNRGGCLTLITLLVNFLSFSHTRLSHI